jgi:hypothetical protein
VSLYLISNTKILELSFIADRHRQLPAACIWYSNGPRHCLYLIQQFLRRPTVVCILSVTSLSWACLTSEPLGVQLSAVVEFEIVILKKFTYRGSYCWPYPVDYNCVHVHFLLSSLADLDSCFCFLIDILPSSLFSVTCCKGITKKLEIFVSFLLVSSTFYLFYKNFKPLAIHHINPLQLASLLDRTRLPSRVARIWTRLPVVQGV